MKIAILAPDKYSIYKIFDKLFNDMGHETYYLNFRNEISKIESSINTQIFRVPHKLRKKWNTYYLEKINSWYLKHFHRIKPDMVFVYNNEFLLPSTLKLLKDNYTKIVFFLGDNPLYTHTNPYNLALLDYADTILVPDTFWQLQLSKMGLQNVNFFVAPLLLDDYKVLTEEEIRNFNSPDYNHDILYVGMSYNHSWGYKKAKFLNYFSNFDLKIYGDRSWKKWFEIFPKLENKFVERHNYIPVKQLNIMFNMSKIIPIDGNPGLFNGMHLRVKEALSAGTMPLIEWSSDIDKVFSDIDNLPVVKDYRKIPEIVKFYLDNEVKRTELVHSMRSSLQKKYSFNETKIYLEKKLFYS